MELISVGNVILNVDRISALDIDQKKDGTFVLRVLTDSPDPIISVNLAPEVPDMLLNLVPHKMRLVGMEALQP
ncbi:MAG: hypothetical protein JWO80_6552 [Bryobacterales bacterium]|nr:hypothetical protein [Bryobacterales bacterium]